MEFAILRYTHFIVFTCSSSVKGVCALCSAEIKIPFSLLRGVCEPNLLDVLSQYIKMLHSKCVKVVVNLLQFTFNDGVITILIFLLLLLLGWPLDHSLARGDSNRKLILSAGEEELVRG